jgi:DNA-binding SARP family transcriptional activator/predicted ATPase/Tfp pilus assembly protein PilF
MEKTIHVRLLGAVQVERDGKPIEGFRSRKALALLGYLAVQDQPVSRERLIDLLWEDKTESQGRNNLSWVLNKISSLLPDVLQADRHTVQFQPTVPYWLDTEAFKELETKGDPSSLAAAVELYRGEFLDGLYVEGCAEFELWVVGEREQWRQRVVSVLRELVAHHSRRGECDEGLRFAQQMLALEPWREETHCEMMQLLAWRGERAAALAQYERCRRVLAEELGVEPAEETTALYERIRKATSAPRHNLPPQPTPFVGREKELAEVSSLLADPDCRLLTILGPGGIGKTRLALQAAAARTETFLEGVYFVSLAPVSSADFIPSAIADALQFSFFGLQEAHIQLLNYLREKEVLLILDSFEHLLASSVFAGGEREARGVDLLAEILHKAPQVKLLVTSRECLNLRWEWRFEIQGLAYPANGNGMDAAATLEDYSAVQLFLQIARRVRPRFSLSGRDRPGMVHICRLVEGMPLGLELAAAWVKTHTTERIAQEIKGGLDFLATSLHDVPERHRSVRAAFERSWRLLAPPAQSVFMKLSVFRRGFRREAAVQVAGASRAVLESLVDKSLLRFLSGGRYDVHELLRQYAAEKLAAAPEAQAQARDQHCTYYTTFLQRHETDLFGAGAAEALTAIRAEIGNVRAAWQWAATQTKLEEMGRGLESLSRFYILAGPFQEGEALIGMAVDQVRTLVDNEDKAPRDGRTILSRLLAEQAHFLNRQGRYDQAIATAQAAIDLISPADEVSQAVHPQAAGYLQWGVALWRQANYEEARTRLEQALHVARSAPTAVRVRVSAHGEDSVETLRLIEVEALRNLGNVIDDQGNFAEGKACYEQSLRLSQEIGYQRGEADALNNLSLVSRYQGDHADARSYLEQALRAYREIGDRRGEGMALTNLGIVFVHQGKHTAAMDCFEQCLRLSREIGDRRSEILALSNLGFASHIQGDYARAKVYYEQYLRICREIGDRRGEGIVLCNLGLLFHHLDDNRTAQEYSQQALLIAQDIDDHRIQGGALTHLGHALAGLGQWTEAAEAYRQALTLRREFNQPHMAMESLAGLAHVSLAQGELIQAQTQVEEILTYLETNTLDGTEEPFRIYLTCYRILCASQDPRAQETLDTAHRLLQEQAAKISDEKMRRLFLKNLTAHREIVEEVDRFDKTGKAR